MECRTLVLVAFAVTVDFQIGAMLSIGRYLHVLSVDLSTAGLAEEDLMAVDGKKTLRRCMGVAEEALQRAVVEEALR